MVCMASPTALVVRFAAISAAVSRFDSVQYCGPPIRGTAKQIPMAAAVPPRMRLKQRQPMIFFATGLMHQSQMQQLLLDLLIAGPLQSASKKMDLSIDELPGRASLIHAHTRNIGLLDTSRSATATPHKGCPKTDDAPTVIPVKRSPGELRRPRPLAGGRSVC